MIEGALHTMFVHHIFSEPTQLQDTGLGCSNKKTAGIMLLDKRCAFLICFVFGSFRMFHLKAVLIVPRAPLL